LGPDARVAQEGVPSQDHPNAQCNSAELVDRLTARATARSDAERVTTRAPYTQAPIADLPMATPDDVMAAFETARRAQREWRDTPVHEREAVMLRFHDLVLARQDEVLDLIQTENGKTRRDAFLAARPSAAAWRRG